MTSPRSQQAGEAVIPDAPTNAGAGTVTGGKKVSALPSPWRSAHEVLRSAAAASVSIAL